MMTAPNLLSAVPMAAECVVVRSGPALRPGIGVLRDAVPDADHPHLRGVIVDLRDVAVLTEDGFRDLHSLREHLGTRGLTLWAVPPFADSLGHIWVTSRHGWLMPSPPAGLYTRAHRVTVPSWTDA